MRGGMRPGMMQHGMQGRPGGPGAGMMRNRGNFRGGGGPGSHMGVQGMWWKNPNVVQRLALTPDQVKRMDGIFQQSRLQLIDLKANLEKQEVLLEPMIGANPPDAAKATVQIDKVADARADLEKANAKMLLGIRGVLTPDQWTKMSDRRFGGPGAADGQPGPAQNGGPGGGPGRGRGTRSGGPGGPAGINGINMDDTRP
jgi:Spy/CpxP family protein refolding chaperone